MNPPTAPDCVHGRPETNKDLTMDIHPPVLTGDISRHDIYAAIDQAFVTTHIGNEPTQLLILGKDETGRVLEITVVVKNEDVLVLFAADARPEYLALVDELNLVPEWSNITTSREPASKYGKSTDGLELTDSLINELYATAERGYDIERLSTRTRPGRPAPLTVGGVVRVGLDPKLYDAAREQAHDYGIAVSDLLEQVLDEYLRATPTH
jgi:hypothetical protein